MKLSVWEHIKCIKALNPKTHFSYIHSSIQIYRFPLTHTIVQKYLHLDYLNTKRHMHSLIPYFDRDTYLVNWNEKKVKANIGMKTSWREGEEERAQKIACTFLQDRLRVIVLIPWIFWYHQPSPTINLVQLSPTPIISPLFLSPRDWIFWSRFHLLSLSLSLSCPASFHPSFSLSRSKLFSLPLIHTAYWKINIGKPRSGGGRQAGRQAGRRQQPSCKLHPIFTPSLHSPSALPSLSIHLSLSHFIQLSLLPLFHFRVIGARFQPTTKRYWLFLINR